MSSAEEAAIVVRFVTSYFNNLSNQPKLHRKAAAKKHGGAGRDRGCSGDDAAETEDESAPGSARSRSGAAGVGPADAAAEGGPGGAFAERAVTGRLKQLSTFLLRCNPDAEAALQPFLERTDAGEPKTHRATPHHTALADRCLTRASAVFG